MKKVHLTAVLIMALNFIVNADIIKNSDFDEELSPEYKVAGNLKSTNCSIHTETGTWNKCGKIEITRFNTDENGRKSYMGRMVMGGEKKVAGFPVDADQMYQFSLELKGTVQYATIGAMYWIDKGQYDDWNRLKTSIEKVKVPKEWTKYKGTFKVPQKAVRAALYVAIWGNEEQKHLPDKPGDYLLMDKIEIKKKINTLGMLANKSNPEEKVVEKKKAIKLNFNSDSPLMDGSLDDKAWKDAAEIDTFSILKNQVSARQQTSAKILAGKNALYFGITCYESDINKLKDFYKGTGEREIWRNDAIEIFLDSTVTGRTLNQFVVGAGGGRWMGWGRQPVQPDAEYYEKWEAKTAKGENAWTAEIKIPYSTLGWQEAPQKGKTLSFNICRQRFAGNKELSSWNSVNSDFHDKSQHGLLAFGSLNKDLDKRIKNFKKQLHTIEKDCPEKEKITGTLNNLSELLEKEITPAEWDDARRKLITMDRKVLFLKLKGMTYAVTAVSPTKTDFSLPLIPDTICIHDKKITCKAAINEFASKAILITNLTNKTQDYRILLCNPQNNNASILNLKGTQNIFPMKNIQMRQGVRVKESDEAMSGNQRFDPLPSMNQAYTLTIPPKDSGLLWLTFDCRNVKSDLYKCFLRVIPLNEAGKINSKRQYKGNMRNIPFELEIMPFELSREPEIALCTFGGVTKSEEIFEDMIERGYRLFPLSPYRLKVDFDEKGNITKGFGDAPRKIIKDHLQWARKYNVNIQFIVAYSIYTIFQKMYENKFSYGSPEWDNAWKNWIKEIDKLFKTYGVSNKDYYLEILDEPPADAFEKIIEVSRLVKDVCPEIQVFVTMGCHSINEYSSQMISIVDLFCIWGAHYNRADVKSFIEELRKNRKKIWMYYCSTSINNSLHRYYRMFAWKGLYYKNSNLNMFSYSTRRSIGYPWKSTPHGGIIYDAFNEAIPSIRSECLREGFTDIKYMGKLKEMLNQSKSKGVDSPLIKEAESFLENAPHEIVVLQAHNTDAAQTAREKAAEFIIKLGLESIKK